MGDVKVSVIVPVYNVEKYLRECLESLVNQTLKEIEIICINDGSEDSSLEILNEYASKDSRFKIISQQNQGQGIARNKGIDIASGEYLQFVDPDDWVETNMLEKLYNFANKNSSNVVRFNYSNYNDYSGKFKKNDFAKHIKKEFHFDLNERAYFSWKDLKKGCLTKFGLNVWSYFYNADYIKRNNIRFAPSKLAEDHLFAIGAILLTDKIDFLNEYLYIYRHRSGSAVHIQTDACFCIFENIELLKQFIIDHSLYEELKEEFQNYSQLAVEYHYDSSPKKSIERYESLCRQYFNTEKDFRKFIKKQRNLGRSFIENVFSIRNQEKDNAKYKAITIFGLTFLIKARRRLG